MPSTGHCHTPGLIMQCDGMDEPLSLRVDVSLNRTG